MWQRFTERARRIILLGQEEAGKMGSGHVGTEHLLIGLVREEGGTAARILQAMGVTLAAVRREVEAEVQPSADPVSSEPKLTPKAKRVLELAADEARRMRHNYIGTEHLLLGLLREKNGIAATVLRRLGLNLEKARSQVLVYLGPDAPGQTPVPPAERGLEKSKEADSEEALSGIRWQRFTERARRIILLGQEEAGKMSSRHVGTEHLLLGLVRENEGVAAQILQSMGVTLGAVRREIEAEIQPSTDPVSAEPILTPKARRVLELAADEARRMGHNYIGTEHLLLALLREKDGLAATVLRRLGLDLEKTRHQVMEYLGPNTPTQATSSDSSPVEHKTKKKKDADSSAYSWQCFTDRVRIIVLLAQEEAMTLGNDHVGTEHLLLALIRQGDGVAAHVLQKLGVSSDAIRQPLEAQLKDNFNSGSITPMLTPVAKRILELAANEAQLMGDKHIGSGHLLLALLRENEGLSLSANVLSQSGLNRDNAVAAMEEYLNSPPQSDNKEQ